MDEILQIQYIIFMNYLFLHLYNFIINILIIDCLNSEQIDSSYYIDLIYYD